jgi:GTP cyclohydrolase II
MNRRKRVIAMRQDLFGSKDDIAVDRALTEFRSGRPIVVYIGREKLIVLRVEGLNEERWLAFRDFCKPLVPALAITSHRARRLGFMGTAALVLKLGPSATSDQILSLAANANVDSQIEIEMLDATAAATAAINLAKLAQALPAVLVAPANGVASAESLISVQAKSIEEFRCGLGASLKLAAQSEVPLQGGIAAHFSVFVDALGRTHTAVRVGQPDFASPVPVRLHSACLTGDVFRSCRCDCGDQLRLSLTRVQEAGGGIILYLAQEGRGVGLANKMHAYRLQDAGLDTVDANTALGFEYDERDYLIAARMLEMLGFVHVLLLTNNPAKIEGLAEAGIDVRGHIPLVAPVTPGNRRYLAAKAMRAGHRLAELLQQPSDRNSSDSTARD